MIFMIMFRKRTIVLRGFAVNKVLERRDRCLDDPRRMTERCLL